MTDSALPPPAPAAPSAPAPPAVRDFTRRTLRSWAVFEVLYGLALAGLVVWLVPWKTPAWNVALCSFAALHVVAAPGLWQQRRWGWRLSLVGGVIGLVLAIAVIAGLLASWAYLRAVYGQFGFGASIGSLLFASIALQALGLYPALLLRALLRREVVADIGGGRHWAKLVVGLTMLPAAAALWMGLHFAMPSMDPAPAAGMQQAMAYLRALVGNTALPPLTALRGVPVGEDALIVSLWAGGRPALRVRGDGADMAEAIVSAGEALLAEPALGLIEGPTRLAIDRVVGLAPLVLEAPPIVALSVNPGLDGLRRGNQLLLADDSSRPQRIGAAPLVPGIDEIRLGLDARPVLAELDEDPTAPLQRLRTETWVEFEGSALPVERGNTPLEETGPESWRQAAIAGGDFILRQIREDGRFHYVYLPLTDDHPQNDDYSLPRHAGTVYALALLYGETGETRFGDGARRAIQWLGEQIPDSCGTPELACVVSDGSAVLGASALALVGMLEYQRRTGDDTFSETSRKLAEFLMMMQRDDGDFHHAFDPATGNIDREMRRMFYSEEAALALVLAFEELGDPRYGEAAQAALDFLTGPKYARFFLGQFIYGADHWTCIAAEEAWPTFDDAQYLEFCRGYAEFIGRLQFEPSGAPEGFSGHYGFTGLLVPQAPAAAGFTEAIISTFALARHHGIDDPDLEHQMSWALDALARDRIRAANAWMMANPQAADGGIRRSVVEQEVRLDFTQHAASALIRGWEVLRGGTMP